MTLLCNARMATKICRSSWEKAIMRDVNSALPAFQPYISEECYTDEVRENGWRRNIGSKELTSYDILYECDVLRCINSY